MVGPLSLLVIGTATLLAGWAAWFVVRDRAVILRQLWGGAVVEGLMLVQAVVALVLVLGGASVAEPITLWGYVVVQLMILPFAAAWAFAERTRWSSVVLLVAGVTVVFLEYRLLQIWGS
ncbi:hypothetical protein ACGIF2_02800 [Cellulomonas sp. P22]|uniref:hypothetical protein n=1 Tax=Cellulomonas sp. P22 TaxID=3373189 RepID=UPI0037A3B71C